jgi:hypothetical protein
MSRFHLNIYLYLKKIKISKTRLTKYAAQLKAFWALSCFLNLIAAYLNMNVLLLSKVIAEDVKTTHSL